MLKKIGKDQEVVEIIAADLADSGHGSAIVELLDEYARDEMGGSSPLSNFVRQNLVAELRKRPGVHVILALAAGHPAGLAICFEGFSTFACKPLLNIHDVMVSEAFRGRGIAKQLLGRAEEIAVSLGCCKLTLEVLEGNAIAKAVYQSLGFSGYQLNPATGRALFWQKKL